MTETLDYSRPGSRRRRRPSTRRLVFDAIVVGLFVGCVIAAWNWESIAGAKRSIDLYLVRRSCVTHTLAPDVGVYIEDATNVADARTTPHHQTGNLPTVAWKADVAPKVALYHSPQLMRLRRMRPNAGPGASVMDPSSATVFLHGRTNPTAGVQLVTVELTLIDQGSGYRWIAFDASAGDFTPPTQMFGVLLGPDERLVVFAGQPDANDASHFIIAYRVNGRGGTIDGYLRDDGSVESVPREGEIQRSTTMRIWKP